MDKFCISIPGNISFTIMKKSIYETEVAFLDPFCMSALIFLDVCSAIYSFFSRKIKDSDKTKVVFANLTVSLLDNYKGFVFSFLSHDFLTVIQKTRIIYECYVIFLYIYKHSDLAEAFFDHMKIMEYKIFKEITGFDEKDNIEIDKLISKYGKEFTETLGWTMEAIKDKDDRKLVTLANDVGMDEKISLMYKMTSSFIHTNAFSAFINNRNKINNIRGYLPFITDIVVRQTVRYVNKICLDKNDYEFINLFLCSLKIELFPELCQK
jgi:hypothetical protein